MCSSDLLAASALLARSEAIKRNAVVTLCASSDGLNCTGGGWEQGWLVTSGTVLQRQLAAPSGLLVSAGGTAALMFQPIGAGATSATFTVCRATPTVGREARVVTIDPTGRPWIKTTNPTTCP